MPSAANPEFGVVMWSDHGNSHPMVFTGFGIEPFTLLASGGPNPLYQVTFIDGLGGNWRTYAIGFTTDQSHPCLFWSGTPALPVTAQSRVVFSFSLAGLNGATQLWIGAWWNDGTYPDTPQGIASYFQNHPSETGHHTVPVLIG